MLLLGALYRQTIAVERRGMEAALMDTLALPTSNVVLYMDGVAQPATIVR